MKKNEIIKFLLEKRINKIIVANICNGRGGLMLAIYANIDFDDIEEDVFNVVFEGDASETLAKRNLQIDNNNMKLKDILTWLD